MSISLKNGGDINSSTQIKDGDVLSLSFQWSELADKSAPLTYVYDFSDKLGNIIIDNQEISLTGITYRIENQVLYIDIESGSSNRSGFCTVTGAVDLSSARVDSNGITYLTFIDKSVDAYAPDKISDSVKDSYTVTLDPKGGTVSPQKITVNPGERYGTLPVPVCDGYVFVNWYRYEAKDLTRKVSGNDFTLESDHILYAKWRECVPVTSVEINERGIYLNIDETYQLQAEA